MPRMIDIEPILALRSGVRQIEVPDGVTDEQALQSFNEQFMGVEPATPPAQPTSIPTQAPGSIGANIAGGLIGGLARIGQRYAFEAEALGFPGAAENRELLRRLAADVAPVTEKGTSALADIYQAEGAGSAFKEAVTRLPGQLSEQVFPTMDALAKGATGFKAFQLLGAPLRVQQLAAGVAAGPLGAGGTEAIDIAEDIKSQGGDMGDQVAGYLAGSAVIGVLSNIPMGIAFKRLLNGPKKHVARSFLNKTAHVLATSGSDALTEWMEEPAQAAVIKSLGFEADVMRSFVAGLDAIPAALTFGGVLGTAAQVAERGHSLSPQTRQDIRDAITKVPFQKSFPASFTPLSLPDEEKKKILEYYRGDSTVANGMIGTYEQLLSAAAYRHGMKADEYYKKTLPKGAFDHIQQQAARIQRGRIDEKTTLDAAAYHGTPHRFEPEVEFTDYAGNVVYSGPQSRIPDDINRKLHTGEFMIRSYDNGRFRLNNIGTGEGAQAYGWGLYFASDKDVGKFYKDKFSQTSEPYFVKKSTNQPVDYSYATRLTTVYASEQGFEELDAKLDDVFPKSSPGLSFLYDPDMTLYDAIDMMLHDYMSIGNSKHIRAAAKAKGISPELSTFYEDIADYLDENFEVRQDDEGGYYVDKYNKNRVDVWKVVDDYVTELGFDLNAPSTKVLKNPKNVPGLADPRLKVKDLLLSLKSVLISSNSNSLTNYKKNIDKHATDPGLNALYKAILRHLDTSYEYVPFKAGSLYTVNLAPQEDEYLLWDKPLSEQSDKVKNALIPFTTNWSIVDGLTSAGYVPYYPIAPDGGVHPEDALGGITGQEFYRGLVEAQQRHAVVLPQVDYSSPGDYPSWTSEALLKHGIRGIKYLDGSSRSRGVGNFNYVIFDEKDIEITGLERGIDEAFNNSIISTLDEIRFHGTPNFPFEPEVGLYDTDGNKIYLGPVKELPKDLADDVFSGKYQVKVHEHGRMRLDKVDTGEGSQSRGWGIYLADVPDTAGSYRDLPPRQQAYFKDGTKIDNESHIYFTVRNHFRDVLGPEKFNTRIDPYFSASAPSIITEENFTYYDTVVSLTEELGYTVGTKELKELRQFIKTKADWSQPVKDFHYKVIDFITDRYDVYADSTKRGAVLAVNIDVPRELFLDLDKKLGEQSEHVRSSLQKIFNDASVVEALQEETAKDSDDITGMEFIKLLDRIQSRYSIELPGVDYTTGTGEAAYWTSMALLSAGIRGNVFLDRFSRDRRAGTSNYVMFDENDMEITGLASQRRPTKKKRQQKKNAKKAAADIIAAAPVPPATPKTKPEGRMMGGLTGLSETGSPMDFRKASRYWIRVFEQADTATVIHELGHFAALTANGKVKEMLGEAFGKPVDQWNVTDHERFTLTFSAWFLTGETKIEGFKGPFTVMKSEMRRFFVNTKHIFIIDPRVAHEVPNKGPVIRGERQKFEAIEALFKIGEWGDTAPADLQNVTTLMDTLLSQTTDSGDDLINHIIANNFRINGVNLKGMLATLPWDKIEKYIVPLIEEMGRSNKGQPITWETSRAQAIDLIEKDPDFMIKIQKAVAKGRLLQPHEIIAMQLVGSLLAASYVKTLTSKVSAKEREDAYAGFRAIVRTTQNAASPIGRALNAFKIFHSMNDLMTHIQFLGRELTPEELEAVVSIDPTDPEQIQALLEKFKSNTKAGAIQQALLGVFYNSMLFNPGTVGINTIGNAMHTIYIGATKEQAAILDFFHNKLTGKPRTVFAGEGLKIIAALGKSAAFANPRANKEFIAAMKGQLEGTAATEYDDKVSSHTIRAFENLFENFNVPGRNTPAMKAFAGMMVAGQRTLTAFDLWYKASIRNAYLGPGGIIESRTKRLAKKQGSVYENMTEVEKYMTQREVEQSFVADEMWINQSNTVKKVTRNWEKAVRKQTGTFPTPSERMDFMSTLPGFRDIPRIKEFQQRAEKQLIEAAEKQKGRKLNANEKDAIKASIDQHAIRLEAASERIQSYVTFQDQPNNLTKNLVQLRDNLSLNFGNVTIPVGRIFVPFISTVMNITVRGTELLPGIGAYVGVRSKSLPMEVAVKQLHGLALFYAIGKLIEAGFLTGPPPEDDDERDAFYRSGKRPWSFRLPDGLYVDYRRFDPFSLAVSMSATAWDELRKIQEAKLDPAKKDRESLDVMLSFGQALKEDFLDSTWFSNMQIVNGDEAETKRLFARTLSSMVPFSAFQRSIYKSYLTYTEGGVPVPDRPSFSETFWGNFWSSPPPRLDVYGEEVRRSPSLPAAWIPPDTELARLTNASLAFLSPVQLSVEQMDQVEAELARLEVYPAMPGRQLTIPGESKPSAITDEVYNEYVIRSGSEFKKQVKQLIASRSYVTADDEARIKLIDKMYNRIRERERNRARRRELQVRRANRKLPNPIDQFASS